MAGSGKVQVQNNIANAKSPSNRSVYSGLNEIIPTMLRRRLFFLGQASAGSAIVLASNGVYASAWGPLLSAGEATAKATRLCQKKGGIDIKVLVSAGSGSVVGARWWFCSIAASGHGPSAIVGYSFRCALPSDADAAALGMCREKGGANPRIVVGWQECGIDGEMPGNRTGKF